MRATKVLLIENARNNGVTFAASLKRKYQVHIANSGKQGIALALEKHPDVIVLDAASLRTSGDRICARLRSSVGQTPIIHIRPKNDPPENAPADVLLSPPFTARKLINRIERFSVPREGKVLQQEPFTLNLEQHTLVTPWSEKKLTPKLVTLMELFMQNQGKTLERKNIMKAVWKTDYMGDTRTLDVHIRWLRKVVEPNPRKPEYIKTVRGVGYQFVISETEAPATEEKTPKQTASSPNAESDKRKTDDSDDKSGGKSS